MSSQELSLSPVQFFRFHGKQSSQLNRCMCSNFTANIYFSCFTVNQLATVIFAAKYCAKIHQQKSKQLTDWFSGLLILLGRLKTLQERPLLILTYVRLIYCNKSVQFSDINEKGMQSISININKTSFRCIEKPYIKMYIIIYDFVLVCINSLWTVSMILNLNLLLYDFSLCHVCLIMDINWYGTVSF